MGKTEIRSTMTQGSLWDKILRFAIPLALTGILQQLFNAADTAIVGRFTGDMGINSMAAVGANAPITSLAVNLFTGIALGGNIVIANAVGRGDSKSVSKAVHTSVIFSLIAGVVMALIGHLFADTILGFLNIPSDVYPLAKLYFRIYITGLPVILLYNFESAIFRGTGDTKTPLLALACSGVLNVGLNLLFVCELHRTVDGVAIATVASNLVSSVFLFIVLLKRDNAVKIVVSELRIDIPTLGKIMRIGLPAGLQSAVFGIANIIINAAINGLGPIVMAASSAAYQIEIFAYYVLNSFSQACTTFVGQNYGAGKIDRCKKSMFLCFIEGVIAMGTSVALILFFGRDILSIFNDDPDVIETGYIRLMVIFSAYIFMLSYETMSGYLRGFGISLIPSILTMIGICVTRVTWIMTIFKTHPSLGYAMAAYPVSLSTTTVLILIALLVLRPSKKYQLKASVSTKDPDESID